MSFKDSRKCYDPFKCHKKVCRSTLRVISEEYSKKINTVKNIKKPSPGLAICMGCRMKLESLISEDVNNNSPDFQLTPSSAPSDSQSSGGLAVVESEISKVKAQEELDTVLMHLDQSPLKLHATAPHNKTAYVKRKVESAVSSIEKKIRIVVGNTEDFLHLSSDAQHKICDMDALIGQLKSKLSDENLTRNQRIQLLTLAPPSWSRQRIMNEFGVGQYIVKQSRKLLKEKGILAVPESKSGNNVLDPNIVNLVINFFQSDDNSRMLPGQKDRISIAKNQYEQKRLLLSNLNELYASFKFEYPFAKIGFSKFCSLRPKWCVLAGAPGTHSICVCAIHQNVILLLEALPIKKSYHNLINYLVCSTENRDCMLRHCPNCPDSESLENFLFGVFEEWEADEEISYYSWTNNSGRVQQIQLKSNLKEYISNLIESLEALIPHSFIAKAQSKFLKEKKENLSIDEALVILDFSENYTFVLQNEVQGRFWARESCSLHPAVLYRTSKENETVSSSFCVLSEDLEHDVPFVHETQKLIVEHLKLNFPEIKRLWYFSDGCAGQYKNYKNFINLCNHDADFDMTASWNFFATSHGKTACDGVGGTVKRLVSRASLQKENCNPIDSVEKMFNYCKANIPNIKFWLIEKETLLQTRGELNNRFAEATTVPGTRSFHHFTPISATSIGTKRVSSDESLSLTFRFSEQEQDNTQKIMLEISTNSYVACVYDRHWFFGLVLSKSEEENDFEISFMHPFGPSPSFHWPKRDDICHVPACSIISGVRAPTTSASARVYYFSAEDVKMVQEKCIY